MNQLPTGFKDFLLHRDMKRFINFVRRWHNLHLLQPLRHLNILFFIHHPPVECCKDYLLIFRLQQNKLRWRRWQNIIEICLIKIYLCVQTSCVKQKSVNNLSSYQTTQRPWWTSDSTTFSISFSSLPSFNIYRI